MHYEWLDAYLLSFPGVEKDYQPVWQWFRYRSGAGCLPLSVRRGRSTKFTAATIW